MKKIIIVFLLYIIQIGFIYSQNNQPKIDKKEKQLVIDSISGFLNKIYVFPDTAKKMSDLIKSNFENGNYEKIINPVKFAEELNKDLKTVYNDKHMNVMYIPDIIRDLKEDKTDEEKKKDEEQNNRFSSINNYGFKEIKILPGGIGYLKFDEFDTQPEAFRIATAAMNYLEHSSAIIIDLRENGGGHPDMEQFLCSYFFEDRVALNSIYNRETNKLEQYWTLPFVPGSKFIKTDLYILTSKNTFSCAEAFTYDFKCLERATIIGETTGGGAHPTRTMIINDNFFISVPYERAINPKTNSNWEKTGVEPDVKVTSDKALETAMKMALTKLYESEKNELIKSLFKWSIDGLKAKLEPVLVDENVLKTYIGSFGQRKITFEDGILYYQREGKPKYKLIPITENYFILDGIDYFRIKFLKEGNSINAIEGHYDDGRIDISPIDK